MRCCPSVVVQVAEPDWVPNFCRFRAAERAVLPVGRIVGPRPPRLDSGARANFDHTVERPYSCRGL
eukprot:5400057-Alexandrium_andersonii.AAC.1